MNLKFITFIIILNLLGPLKLMGLKRFFRKSSPGPSSYFKEDPVPKSQFEYPLDSFNESIEYFKISRILFNNLTLAKVRLNLICNQDVNFLSVKSNIGHSVEHEITYDLKKVYLFGEKTDFLDLVITINGTFTENDELYFDFNIKELKEYFSKDRDEWNCTYGIMDIDLKNIQFFSCKGLLHQMWLDYDNRDILINKDSFNGSFLSRLIKD